MNDTMAHRSRVTHPIHQQTIRLLKRIPCSPCQPMMILALRHWTYWVRNKIGRSERILPAELIFRFISIRRWYATVKDIFECFDFHTQVDRLSKAGLLYLVSEKFANIDLHPKVVNNIQMGTVFEELIRKFAELSNETAGEHMSPREVIRLMVNLLFLEESDILSKPGVFRPFMIRPSRPPACRTMGSSESSSTTCCPIHRSGWNGRRSKPSFARSTSNKVSTVASVPVCPESAMVRSAGSDCGTSNRHVLQHRHQHVRLDRQQPQTGTPQRQAATHRR